MENAQKAIALAAVLLAACSPAPPAAAGVTMAWHAHMLGAVDGTAAVAGGVAFVGSAGGDLVALDVRTGGPVWVRHGLGPIADSPAVDSGRVFVGTLSGHLRALSTADGASLWDWAGPPNAALWSSPVLYRGLLIVGLASPYGDTPLVPGELVAVDELTGRERWTTCILAACAPGGGVWSTVAFDSSGTAFVGVGNPVDGDLAFDPMTGKHKWLVSLYADSQRDLDAGARPIVANANGRELVIQATVGGTLAALDAATGGAVWARALVQGSAVHGLIASPAFDGADLYVPSASPPNGVFAVGAADGAVSWRHPTPLPVYSSPALAGGLVIFGTGAVFGDLNAGSIVALSSADGREAWTFPTHSAVRSGPVVAGGLVIAGDYAGDVLGLRMSSGS